MKRLEHAFERLLFTSRWLMAPIYLGLVIAMALLLVKFCKELFGMIVGIGSLSGGDLIVGVLTLVDVSLVVNLILIITFAGYESFVSKMDIGDHDDKPEWMRRIEFSDLKIKVIASIVAISGAELLNIFMNIDDYTDRHLAWAIGLHMTFVASGIGYAMMDRLGHANYASSKDDH